MSSVVWRATAGHCVLAEPPLLTVFTGSGCLACGGGHTQELCAALQKDLSVKLCCELPKLEADALGALGDGDLPLVRMAVRSLGLWKNARETQQMMEDMWAKVQERTKGKGKAAVVTQKCSAVAQWLLKCRFTQKCWPEALEKEEDLAKWVMCLRFFAMRDTEGERWVLFRGLTATAHECRPNCVASVRKDGSLRVHAVRNVKEEEEFTVDFGADLSFESTPTRQTVLESCFGIACYCSACTVLPDMARSFLCPVECREWQFRKDPQTRMHHIVCPSGDGRKATDWVCRSCGYQLSHREIAQVTFHEKVSEEHPPETIEAVEDLLSAGAMRREHYVIFHAMLRFGVERYDRIKNNGAASSPKEWAWLESLWVGLLDCATTICPDPHPKVIQMLEILIDIYVCGGQHDKAEKVRKDLKALSSICYGAEAISSK